MSLESKLRALASAGLDASFRPVFFDLTRAFDRRAVVDLLDTNKIVRVRDAVLEQLRELCASRAASLRLSSDELDAVVRDHLGSARLNTYGTWAHYPWLRSLVHVLPEAEHRELQSARSRYTITPDESRRLRSFTIGVVGLASGLPTVAALAQSGIGGKLRLADAGTLSLADAGRMLLSLDDVGAPLASLAARRAFEIDPYLQIDVFAKELRGETLEIFLGGGGGGVLDLIIDASSDLSAKVLLRERARARGIPVIAVTGERGMLDVERFDLEPDRPLLHGLLEGVRAGDLAGLSLREQIPLIARVLGQGALTGRASASLLEVQETLTKMPELASSVALSGAIASDAARRVLLGDLRGSGRFYTDLAVTVRDGGSADLGSATELDRALIRSAPREPAAPRLVRAGRSVRPADIRRIVAHALLAPSRGNAQPWWFVARAPLLRRPARIRCYAAPAPSLLDFDRMLTHIALGAATLNMELAASASGMRAAALPFPIDRDPSLVCEIALSSDASASSSASPLASSIGARVTSREPSLRDPLDDASRAALDEAATFAGGKLQWVTDPASLDELGAICGAAERIELLTRAFHEELFGELRFTEAEVLAERDGLDVTTMGLTPPDVLRLWLMRSWEATETLASTSGGKSLGRPAARLFARTPAVALLSVSGSGRDGYFQGGRALQRVWLTATSMGLAIHPLSDLIALFARVMRNSGAVLGEAAVSELRALRRRYLALFRVASGETEIMLLRVHRGAVPAIRAQRRALSSVLAFEDAEGHRTRPDMTRR